MNVTTNKPPAVEDFAKRWCDDTEFALREIFEVAEQRQDSETMAQCRALQHTCVRTLSLSSVLMTHRSKRRLLKSLDIEVLQVAEKLRMVINLEMRETVWPLPEIKESTHKFASSFVPSKYFKWLPENAHRSPEELVGILQHQLDQLDIAINTVRKHEGNKTQKKSGLFTHRLFLAG